ncbi:potassium transporter Kup [Prosthecomicrobium sp. N25]|uniref:potassium transporter Kup n=1 Tax=Prosthecomicrobium sp. N25 TaxID=3129254 RepID=UPI0030770958
MAQTDIQDLASPAAPAPSAAPLSSAAAPHGHHAGALAALGIVFGDIGTSPIYTLDTALKIGVVAPVAPDVLGFLSLAIWSLVIVVGVWYAIFIMRADNRGEGGIFALMALAHKSAPAMGGFIAVLGIIGASLFYGDAVITPAISVLSAVEGLAVTAPALESLVLPAALVILTTLFAVQKSGASKVGRFFGPIMLLWFGTLAALGLWQIVKHPAVLAAFDPRLGLGFLARSGPGAFAVLAVVVLAVTGAEALYADMGHVGRGAVRKAFAFIVAPSLIINYLGQGAHVLADPVNGIHDTFFHLVPPALQPALVVLATAATVIASQAVISGAFAVTHQASHLGFWPRTETRHTSAAERGQVYVPSVNLVLFVAVIAVVLVFQKSEKLAEAYGFAVTGTMVVTSMLAYLVARGVWGWPVWKAAPVVAFFMIFDVSFFLSCATKLLHGAWLPLVLGVGLVLVMTAWRMGRTRLAARRRHEGVPVKIALSALRSPRVEHVRGTAVYLMEDRTLAPRAFLHNLKHNKSCHQQIVFLSIQTADTPWNDDTCRAIVEPLGEGIALVQVRFGFMEPPDIPGILKTTEQMGIHIDRKDLSYFVSRAHLVEGDEGGLWAWLRGLFIFLYRNQADPAEYYNIPPGRVVDLGAQITV